MPVQLCCSSGGGRPTLRSARPSPPCWRSTAGAASTGGLAGLALGGGTYNDGIIDIDDLDLIFGNEADLYRDFYLGS